MKLNKRDHLFDFKKTNAHNLIHKHPFINKSLQIRINTHMLYADVCADSAEEEEEEVSDRELPKSFNDESKKSNESKESHGVNSPPKTEEVCPKKHQSAAVQQYLPPP